MGIRNAGLILVMWQGRVSTYIVITVRSDIRIGLVEDLLGGVVHEVVPDGFSLSVCIPASLDLVGGGAHAPDKVRGEPAHVGSVLG